MRNILVLFSIFHLAVFSISGQENALYREIQQAKKSNVYFENVVLCKVSAEVKALERFINPDEVFFFGNISFDVNSKTKAMNLVMPLKTKNMILELTEAPESFYDYEIITSSGKKFPANRDIRHYRGVVKNENNSLAAITICENEIIGLVCTDEGNFNLVRDKQSGKHLFYNDKNLKEKAYPACSTPDDLSFSYDPEVLLIQRNPTSTGRGTIISKPVRLYVETEYDMYDELGSVAAVEAFVSGLFNIVAALYRNEDIQISVSNPLFVWDKHDSKYPYTAMYSALLLAQFQKERTSINGDLGILLTFKKMPEGGLVDKINGLCDPYVANRLAVTPLREFYTNTYNYLPIPYYSWPVAVVTHEIGHLLGSPHTHTCFWNGNNTAIDGCYSVEGACPQPALSSDPGTIMSYCALTGGPGIDFYLGFGRQPGNVIRNTVLKATCLPCSFTNQIVAADTIVIGSNINVHTVTVTNNAKLTLDAPGEVIITNDFEVQLGSELEIK